MDNNQGNSAPNANAGSETTDQIEKDDVKFEDDELSLLDDEISNKVKSMSAQKAHWREKAQKNEERLKALEQELEGYKKPKPEPEKKEKQDDKVAALERKLAGIELTQAHPGLDQDDMDIAFHLAEKQGKNPADVVGSDFFQSYLKDKKAKKEAANSTPSPSNRSGNSGGRYKLEDLNDPEKVVKMDQKEFERLSNEAGKRGSRYTSMTSPE